MKKPALIALVVILVLAAVGGALWAAVRFALPPETDPAAIVPSGARVYLELDATRMSAEELAVADQYAAFTRTLIGGDYAIPPMKDLGCRGALVVYGTAKLQGMIPGVVIVLESPKPEVILPLEEKLLKNFESSERSERELDGWTLTEIKKKGMMNSEVYLGFARRGSLRIFATGKSLLEECIRLAAADGIEGTLAGDAGFRAAFEGLPFPSPDRGSVGRLKGLVSGAPRSSQRIYVDLKGLCDDIHPALSVVGGETYRTIKEKLLDYLKAFAGTSGPENGGLRSVSAIRFSSSPPWLRDLAEARLEWPGRSPDGAAMTFAVALPKSAADAVGLLIGASGGPRSQAQIGQVHGVIGSINGALAMYFADHSGEFPVADTPVSIGEIGLVPTYMSEEPKTPWKGSYLYQGDGATYVISARYGGDSITWYSSATGRVESVENASERMEALAKAEAARITALLSGIRELGFAAMPREQRGLEALMAPGFTKVDSGQVLAIRFENAAAALTAESGIVALLPEASRGISIQRVNDWIFLGETGMVASIRPAGGASSGEGFLRSNSVFDLAQIVSEERVKDLPAAHRWTNTGNGVVDGPSIVFESIGTPDPMPAIFGALGALVHAEKLDLPSLFGKRGARNRSGRTDTSTEARGGTGPSVGAPALPVVGVGLDGKPVSLAAFKGRIVILDFWATWCGPCVAEMPKMKEAYRRFHGKGLEIIGISLDQEEEKLREFVEREGIPWPQILDGRDGSASLASAYGVNAIPSVWIIGKDGTIVATGLRGDDLLAKLEELFS